MERKQGFFSALRDEVVRGLSPARSRGKSPARSSSSPMTGFLRLKPKQLQKPEPVVIRSGSLSGETLAPLIEGPDPAASDLGETKRPGSGIGQWMKGHLSRAPSMTSSMAYKQRSDLRLLLGVMGAPLAPVNVSSSDPLPHLSIKDTPIVSVPFSISFSCDFRVTFLLALTSFSAIVVVKLL